VEQLAGWFRAEETWPKQYFACQTWNSRKMQFFTRSQRPVRKNPMVMPSTNSSRGTVPNRDWPLTKPKFRLYPFFLASHRAFIIADSFFLIAGLIGLRPAAFFWTALPFFGAALPFCFAQRCFIAALILARAAALMRRRFRPAACTTWLLLGGRPRRGAAGPSPTRAAIAYSMRSSSCLSCATML